MILIIIRNYQFHIYSLLPPPPPITLITFNYFNFFFFIISCVIVYSLRNKGSMDLFCLTSYNDGSYVTWCTESPRCFVSFQSVIFHVETHPKYRTFTQCVTFKFFPSANHELAYNLFNLITLYALPLLIITTSYSLILWKISKKTKQCKGKSKKNIAEVNLKKKQTMER